MQFVASLYYKGISRFFRTEKIIGSIFTTLEESIIEIEKRRNDKKLISKVEAYLENDIPAHFNSPSPVFYLSRFLATPNLEFFHVHELAQNYSYPLVVGQDTKSNFSTNNETKICLGKLPLIKGLSRDGKDIIEYRSIVDFTKYQGKPINTINTKFDISLVDFHKYLFSLDQLKNVVVANEDDWVDRNFRDDICRQYKRMLALLCVHGIMFEAYPSSEHHFFKKIVYPAFKEVELKIGVKPLIVEHISDEQENLKDWNAYPAELYSTITQYLAKST